MTDSQLHIAMIRHGADWYKNNACMSLVQIGHEGARYLAASLKLNTSLRELDLSSSGLGSSGALLLADVFIAAHNTSLTYLSLANNGIGHEIAVQVDLMMVGSSIISLDLGGNLEERQPDESGVRVGVGLLFARPRGGMFAVERMWEDGPAARSGEVSVGDVLLSVEGRSMVGASDEDMR